MEKEKKDFKEVLLSELKKTKKEYIDLKEVRESYSEMLDDATRELVTEKTEDTFTQDDAIFIDSASMRISIATNDLVKLSSRFLVLYELLTFMGGDYKTDDDDIEIFMDGEVALRCDKQKKGFVFNNEELEMSAYIGSKEKISGIGVKEYYRKLKEEYDEFQEFLKKLDSDGAAFS